MVETDPTEPRRSNDEPPHDEPEHGLEFGDLRDHVPADVRDASFPGAVRGYDRAAVDAYVERVNTVIAELEVSRSPQAAVRHALDRVGRQTSGILQRARETADEMSATAWAEADRTTARANAKAEEINTRARAEAEATISAAKAEAAERLEQLKQEIAALQEQAEMRLRELETDTDAVWRRRTQIVDELGDLAKQLETVASEATTRFPARQQAAPQKPRDDDTSRPNEPE